MLEKKIRKRPKKVQKTVFSTFLAFFGFFSQSYTPPSIFSRKSLASTDGHLKFSSTVRLTDDENSKYFAHNLWVSVTEFGSFDVSSWGESSFQVLWVSLRVFLAQQN